MLSGELFDKIETLKEIEKIVNDNNLGGVFYNLSNMIEYLELYKKFGIDDVYIRNGGTLSNEIDYMVGIYTVDNILGIGDINKEQLLRIKFSGRNTFGNECPFEYFDKFFKELQIVKPKYVDNRNYAIYYSSENSKEGYEHFKKVFNEYIESYGMIKKELKIKELEQELEMLKE